MENIRYIGGMFSMESESAKVDVESWRRSSASRARFPAASQMVKVVVKKDGHRFCTHINHDVATQPESPEHQSRGRNQE